MSNTTGGKPAEAVSPHPKRLVVVEDDAPLNELMVSALVDQGFQVASALDGHRAMEIVETGDFDAVLLDLNLPGVNGRAVLAELRERWPQLPAIVISGLVSPQDEQLLLKAGASAVVPKPVRLNELASIIEKITD
jgi:DNA-binding response OmpR family regulator